MVFIYLAAIILANLSIAHFGPAVSIVNAFLFIGLDLTSRDRLHDAWGRRGLLWKMAVLIASGSGLSWLINKNAGAIALASFVAFALSASTDAIAYHLLRGKAKFQRVNGSNLAGAAVDSLVFPLLAFGWPLMWIVCLGQFVAKVFGGLLWSFLV